MLLSLIKHQQPDIDKISLYVKESEAIGNVYQNVDDYNPTRKSRVLILFDDIIADMKSTKKVITKVKMLPVFISQSYFKVPKTIRGNARYYFIMKIPNKIKLQQITSNHLMDTDFKDFMKLYKDYIKELYSFLVNDTTLSPDNPLRFSKNLL